jgi:hypothetical protein
VRTTKGNTVQRDQTVLEMVEEVLERQAKALADNTGQPFASALEIVASTEAGRQLRELRDGPNCHEKARDWQADLAWDRAEEQLMSLMASGSSTDSRYSWVEDYLVRLEGKEAREEYYAALEWLHA